MIKIIAKDKCCGCHGCYNVCPADSIKMEQDNEGFWYPFVDESKCINCQLCEKVCPELNPAVSEYLPVAYAAINKNDKIRYASSSGGLFTLIAEYVLNHSGVVFGAAFNNDFDVCHKEVTNSDELAMLRGSKYVQSRIGDTYKQVKAKVESGTLVLFTGTPCQVNGLKTFLVKDYDNLICIDIICHGVPSPLVWRKYVDHRITVDGGIIQRIAFRMKDEGWKLYAVLFEYKNKTAYRKDLNNDKYMRGFLKNLYLRPSCYACNFKTEQRVSDFTLADFWGIQRLRPEMDDDKGTSLVIVQSDKGASIFEAINDKTIYKSVKLAEAIRYNPSMVKSVSVNRKRKLFFKELDKGENIEVLIDKYTKKNFLKRGLEYTKRVVKNIIGRK